MKTYHNGLIQNQKRHCTDLFCCILLLILIATLLIFGIHAWTTNSFSKLQTGYDAQGKGCGIDYPQYPLIYFVSPSYDTMWRTVCVKQCPTGNETALKCQPNKYVGSCEKAISNDSNMAVQIYGSVGLKNRVCVPTSQILKQTLYKALGKQTWQVHILTLSNVWPVLLYSIPIALVLSLLIMIMINCTGRVFIYIMLILSVGGCVALGVLLIVNQNISLFGIGVADKISTIVLGALLIALAVVIVLGLICYRKKIKLATTIVQLSAKFIKQNCHIVLLPIVLFILMVAFICWWILQTISYYSLGQPVHSQKQLPFQHYTLSSSITALMYVQVFHLLWVIFYIIETNNFIVSGAATSWYYQRDWPYSQSLYRYFRYHMGSVAYGAFLMALFSFIRFIYQLLVPKDQIETKGFKYYLKKCCDCCCYLCISYIFKMFNSGAYTFIHLSGDTYCSSAWEVAANKLKQIVTTSVIAFLDVIFSILIRIGITSLTVLICYIILQNAYPYVNSIYDYTVPLIIIAIIAFTISSFFVALYSGAMQALYVCYLMGKQGGGNQNVVPQELKSLLRSAKKQAHYIVQ